MRIVFGLLLLACLTTACVPLALYNYATHDVAGEANASDCARKSDACKVQP